MHPQKDKIMNGLYTILLLVLSNIFMTLAWYGHLKLQQTGAGATGLLSVSSPSVGLSPSSNIAVIPHRFQWIMADPFNLVQLEVPECVSLISLAIIANIFFKGQGLHWNHLATLCWSVQPVYFVFMESPDTGHSI